MPRLTYSKRSAIRQAVALQQLCVASAQLLGRDVSQSEDKEQRARLATGLSDLVKGWRVLEDAKRILKGDPLPGSGRFGRPKAKSLHAHPGGPFQPGNERPSFSETPD